MLTKYTTSDCGGGYYRTILYVNLLTFFAFVPNMIVILILVTTPGVWGTLSAPVLYNNPFMVASWAFGILLWIPGLMAAHSNNAGTRGVMLNLWVGCLVVFFVLVLASGAYLTHDFRTNNDALDDVIKASFKKIGKPLPDGYKKAGGKLKDYMKTIGASLVYKSLPFPADAFFFLHWQIGLTAIAFCAIPAAMAAWAAYHALGIRNYFATMPVSYKDTSISEGPFYDSSEDEEEDEVQPLSKRHKERKNSFSSQVTQVQGEPVGKRGRIVAGKAISSV